MRKGDELRWLGERCRSSSLGVSVKVLFLYSLMLAAFSACITMVIFEFLAEHGIVDMKMSLILGWN